MSVFVTQIDVDPMDHSSVRTGDVQPLVKHLTLKGGLERGATLP